MEKIEAYIQMVFHVYIKVAAWVLFATSCFITFFGGKDVDLDVGLLWQMQGVSLLCVAGTVLFLRKIETAPKKEIMIKFLFGFLYINAVVMGAGAYFQWYSFSNWKMVAFMFLSVVMGYLVVGVLNFRAAMREALLMNKKLGEQLENEEEEENH
ncbi:MAG: hypothetical protein NC307_13035 [Roseburia sp.]|nr:hypothetical protein [Roseburia sp.]